MGLVMRAGEERTDAPRSGSSIDDESKSREETAGLLADKAGEISATLGLEAFKEAITPILTSVVGGAAAVAGGVALPPLAGLVVGVAVRSGVAAWNRRGERWWQGFLEAFGPASQEERERSLREGLKSENARQAVFVSVRSLLDALDDGVAEPLGRLAAEYYAQGKAADWFFRGLTRVLADLSATEYHAMRMMLTQFMEHAPRDRKLIEVHQTDQGFTIEKYLEEPNGEIRRDDPIVLSSSISAATRFFTLLKQNALGRDNAAGYWGSVSGPHVLVIERDTILRVLQFMR